MLGHAAAVLERIRNIGRILGRGSPSCRRPDELAAMLAGEAAFVAQKTVTEFGRLRAGCNWASLSRTEEFRREVERSRWRSYIVALGDVAEMTQILFRRAGAVEAAQPDRLGPVARRALFHHGTPPLDENWAAVAEAIEARLGRALLAAPRPVHLLGERSGQLLFDLLPFSTNLRDFDRDFVVNSVRFTLCAVYARLERRIDVSALAQTLRAPSAADG
jgi:hypothetical protein